MLAKTRRSTKFPRRIGRLLFAATVASAVVGGVAFYRHPSATGRQLLRLRLLLSGASEHTEDARGLPVRYFESLPSTPRPTQETLVLVHGFGRPITRSFDSRPTSVDEPQCTILMIS